MQTTLTSSIITTQSNYTEISQKLDHIVNLHNLIERKLYADIHSYLKLNKTTKLPSIKINQLKCDYIKKYNINSRQYNSIKFNLDGKIASILVLNKDYLSNTKDKIKQLDKTIKSKNKTLNKLLEKKELSKIDKANLINLKTKLFYLKQKLTKNNNKLKNLLEIECTGNPNLCFGSNKLFKQQFQINSDNNLTQFKSHAEWLELWTQSRNKTFCLIGSLDETLGNENCQIKHIINNTYELKVNFNPNAIKLKDRYLNIQIEIHNDNNNLIRNILNNDFSQALTYRFYKDYKKNTYKVFISLDKSKQQPLVVSCKQIGVVGIDINSDHISIAEVDRFGNLLMAKDYPLALKDKSSNQSTNNIALAVKEITNYAVKVNKPIVIENLDFSQKKKELKSGINKKYNFMLSSFAYSKIIELVKSRSFDKGIEVIEVNPAYTSKIGKFKYQELYKLTTHQAAALVIARRGLLSTTKNINVKLEKKDKEGKIIEVSYKRKEITVLNKEKAISIRRSKYYFFELPARNIQRQNNIYWKEIEQNYTKAKKHRLDLKNNFILSKDSNKSLLCEITQVANNFGINPRAYRSSESEPLQPF